MAACHQGNEETIQEMFLPHQRLTYFTTNGGQYLITTRGMISGHTSSNPFWIKPFIPLL
jgi:hypothetical protein